MQFCKSEKIEMNIDDLKYNVPFSCAPFWQFREIYTLNDQAKTSPSAYRGRVDNKCVEINVRETEGAIKNRQSRETGNIVYTRHRTK
jgi:hypothetical protein